MSTDSSTPTPTTSPSTSLNALCTRPASLLRVCHAPGTYAHALTQVTQLCPPTLDACAPLPPTHARVRVRARLCSPSAPIPAHPLPTHARVRVCRVLTLDAHARAPPLPTHARVRVRGVLTLDAHACAPPLPTHARVRVRGVLTLDARAPPLSTHVRVRVCGVLTLESRRLCPRTPPPHPCEGEGVRRAHSRVSTPTPARLPSPPTRGCICFINIYTPVAPLPTVQELVLDCPISCVMPLRNVQKRS